MWQRLNTFKHEDIFNCLYNITNFIVNITFTMVFSFYFFINIALYKN